jgi:hypothetical protein
MRAAEMGARLLGRLADVEDTAATAAPTAPIRLRSALECLPRAIGLRAIQVEPPGPAGPSGETRSGPADQGQDGKPAG